MGKHQFLYSLLIEILFITSFPKIQYRGSVTNLYTYAYDISTVIIRSVNTPVKKMSIMAFLSFTDFHSSRSSVME